MQPTFRTQPRSGASVRPSESVESSRSVRTRTSISDGGTGARRGCEPDPAAADASSARNASGSTSPRRSGKSSGADRQRRCFCASTEPARPSSSTCPVAEENAALGAGASSNVRETKGMSGTLANRAPIPLPYDDAGASVCRGGLPTSEALPVLLGRIPSSGGSPAYRPGRTGPGADHGIRSRKRWRAGRVGGCGEASLRHESHEKRDAQGGSCLVDMSIHPQRGSFRPYIKKFERNLDCGSPVSLIVSVFVGPQRVISSVPVPGGPWLAVVAQGREAKHDRRIRLGAPCPRSPRRSVDDRPARPRRGAKCRRGRRRAGRCRPAAERAGNPPPARSRGLPGFGSEDEGNTNQRTKVREVSSPGRRARSFRPEGPRHGRRVAQNRFL